MKARKLIPIGDGGRNVFFSLLVVHSEEAFSHNKDRFRRELLLLVIDTIKGPVFNYVFLISTSLFRQNIIRPFTIPSTLIIRSFFGINHARIVLSWHESKGRKK